MLLDLEKLHAIAAAPDTSEERRRLARALRAAMNDWPTVGLVLVGGFLQELSASFAPFTYESIKAAASRMDIRSDAWKAEALAVLLGAWSVENRHKTLNELLGDLHQVAVNE